MIIYENLTLKNQDLTIDGDLRLIGKNKICNGNLIVTGTLELLDNSGICELELTNGNLTTDSIYCPYSPSIISINDDININSGAYISNHINSSNNLCGKISCINLHVNGDILLPALEVKKNIFADSIFACNGFTCGSNAYIKYLDASDYNVYV